MAKYCIRACRVGYIEIEANSEKEAYEQAPLSAVEYDWEDDVFDMEIVED